MVDNQQSLTALWQCGNQTLLHSLVLPAGAFRQLQTSGSRIRAASHCSLLKVRPARPGVMDLRAVKVLITSPAPAGPEKFMGGCLWLATLCAAPVSFPRSCSTAPDLLPKTCGAATGRAALHLVYGCQRVGLGFRRRARAAGSPVGRLGSAGAGYAGQRAVECVGRRRRRCCGARALGRWRCQQVRPSMRLAVWLALSGCLGQSRQPLEPCQCEGRGARLRAPKASLWSLGLGRRQCPLGRPGMRRPLWCVE